MRIILEPSDFPETYCGRGDKSVEVSVPRALKRGYTLTVVQGPRKAKETVGRVEATFLDLSRQVNVLLAGPVEVEFAAPDRRSKRETRTERTLQ